MSLATLSYSISLALPAALLFAVLLAGAQWLELNLPRRRMFLATIPTSPADRLWRRQHRLGRLRSRAVLPLLFLMITALLLTAVDPSPPDIFGKLVIQLTVLVSGAMIAICTLAYAIRLTLARRHLRLLIDANLAIAQALQKLSGNRNRTFHDVPTAAGELDHVIVGVHGIYAVSVIARHVAKADPQHLQLRGDVLTFGDQGQPIILQTLHRRVMYFARACSKVLGQDVQVRHVIAIPGWEISVQASDHVLIANERNIQMLTGWKDERDYLMDEDVEALHGHLDKLCARPI